MCLTECEEAFTQYTVWKHALYCLSRNNSHLNDCEGLCIQPTSWNFGLYWFHLHFSMHSSLLVSSFSSILLYLLLHTSFCSACFSPDRAVSVKWIRFQSDHYYQVVTKMPSLTLLYLVYPSWQPVIILNFYLLYFF